MLPIQVIYTENGQPKGPLAEHKRRVEILEHNQEVNYPDLKKSELPASTTVALFTPKDK